MLALAATRRDERIREALINTTVVSSRIPKSSQSLGFSWIDFLSVGRGSAVMGETGVARLLLSPVTLLSLLLFLVFVLLVSSFKLVRWKGDLVGENDQLAPSLF